MPSSRAYVEQRKQREASSLQRSATINSSISSSANNNNNNSSQFHHVSATIITPTRRPSISTVPESSAISDHRRFHVDSEVLSSHLTLPNYLLLQIGNDLYRTDAMCSSLWTFAKRNGCLRNIGIIVHRLCSKFTCCRRNAYRNVLYGYVRLENCYPSQFLEINRIYKILFTDSLSTQPEWEFSSPGIALRSPNSFVGLKNGGATCYMNSVFQQVWLLSDT